MAGKITFKRDPKTGTLWAYQGNKKLNPVGGMGDVPLKSKPSARGTSRKKK